MNEVMRFARFACQGFQCSIESFLPEVDVRPAFVVLPARSAYTVLLAIFHQGVAVFHVLCYTLHEA